MFFYCRRQRSGVVRVDAAGDVAASLDAGLDALGLATRFERKLMFPPANAISEWTTNAISTMELESALTWEPGHLVLGWNPFANRWSGAPAA